MLYLEDYLEMIEHLPQELRDRFTEMREMDLSVQNNMDTLEKRVRVLFSQCRRGDLQSTQSDNEFGTIRKDYYKTLEDADEKVQLASQMYDLVERYLRRLDSELYKFKSELEADHNGITEILEKRSLELDGGTNSSNTSHQKENRFFGANATTPTTRENSSIRYRSKPEKRRDSSSGIVGNPEKRQAISTNLNTPASTISSLRPTTPNINSQVLNVTPSTPAAPYNLQNIGAGNAIAAAASQAIAATQQMQHGRRTASLKASYEAIHGNASGTGVTHELLIGKELAGATHNAIQAVEREAVNSLNHRRQKKKSNTSLSGSQQSQSLVLSSSSSSSQNSNSNNSSSNNNNNSTSNNSHITETIITTGSVNTVTGNGPGLNGSNLNNISSSGTSNSITNNVINNSSNVTSNNSNTATTVGFTDNSVTIEQASAEGEWTYDPNEPRYCICNQVSYGDMVACDNEDCPFEWFHYPCVGITQSPKGKWYCPQCTSAMRRRGARKT